MNADHKTQSEAHAETADRLRTILDVQRLTKRYAVKFHTGTTRCACGHTSAIYATALDARGKYVSTDPVSWCRHCG